MSTIQSTKVKGFTETKKLLAALSRFSDETQLTFQESRDIGNLYALSVGSDNPRIIRKMAELFGCPDDELPTAGGFENSDYWNGEISFRDVADELTNIWGEFFDETISLFGLRVQVGA